MLYISFFLILLYTDVIFIDSMYYIHNRLQ